MSQIARPAGLSLDAKVGLLRDPRTYPEPPGRISTVETHMSWVFLTDRHAYKMKKPVRYAFLDFSTLAARERNCREELRLNQRLAPDTYLAVVPLAVAPAGAARLEGDGVIAEWLVKMRRLRAERMLDALIRAGGLETADVRRVATVLANFYRESPPIEMSGATYRALYAQMIGENRAVLAAPEYALLRPQAVGVHDALMRTLERMPEMFDRRAQEGRIVEGHGDLRPEHVCLEARPVIFDRLEFNRDLRRVDAVEELCFLAMECERLGASFVGDVLFEVYTSTTGDEPPPALRAFYMAHRACIRARLAALHTVDLNRSLWPKWLRTASEYLELAQGYTRRLPA